MIYEIKSYSDDEGRRITERLPLIKNSQNLDSLVEVSPTYMGIIIEKTPMGNIPIPFAFPIGHTVDRCFEDFDRLAQEKIEEIKNSSRIIPASGMPKIQK